MDSDDVVDPGDAAIQALLALTAENTHDPEKRDTLIDAILTMPSLTEWPPEWREKLMETCRFIQGLSHDLSQTTGILDVGADSSSAADQGANQTSTTPHGGGP